MVKAVIFDMDGVLIDSEALWRLALMDVFAGAGIPYTETDADPDAGNAHCRYRRKSVGGVSSGRSDGGRVGRGDRRAG